MHSLSLLLLYYCLYKQGDPLFFWTFLIENHPQSELAKELTGDNCTDNQFSQFGDP